LFIISTFKGGAKGFNEVRAKIRAKGFNEVRAKIRGKGFNEVRAKIRGKGFNEVRAKCPKARMDCFGSQSEST
jgi:hypothetical protein